MDTFNIILSMICAAVSLYQAGKFAAALEFDREVFETKSPTHLHVFYWLNLFLGLYFIIIIYGLGIERGGA